MERTAEWLDRPFEERARQHLVIGSPEDCHEQLRPYREELGVTHFVFRTHSIGRPVSHALHSLRMIAFEPIPTLRQVRSTLAAPPAP